jgi:hypothetical protein
MRLGRREFLKVMGASLGHAALSSAPVPWILNNTYVHKELGIAFSKPDSWSFTPLKDIARVAGEIGQRHSRDDLQPSLMNISQRLWDAQSPTFCPGINIYRYPCGRDSLDKYVRTMLSEPKMYDDFQCVQPPMATEISGLEAYQAETSFVFDTSKLDRPTPVRMRSLIVQQDDRLYSITMCDSPRCEMDQSQIFDEFTRSLRIA